MDGLLVIDKPAGPTSHDVVAIVRRVLGVDRAGHTGTLDPLATGVLAILVGRATRLASFLSGAEKEYLAAVCFGASTATYDAEGAGARADAGPSDDQSLVRTPTEAEVRAALPAFLGTYAQQPPPFSAKKIAGTPAYKLARRGAPVEMKAVEVTVRDIELCAFRDRTADVRLVCSSGFYVRSFAHDLGQRLGCGAFLERLRRTRVADLTVDRALSLQSVIDDPAGARSGLVPMDHLLPHLPAIVLSETGVRKASHGNAVTAADLVAAGDERPEEPVLDANADARFRMIDASGRLIGIARPAGAGLLHPVIVLV
jgi:tRNA pseudouridine55 synthase